MCEDSQEIWIWKRKDLNTYQLRALGGLLLHMRCVLHGEQSMEGGACGKAPRFP